MAKGVKRTLTRKPVSAKTTTPRMSRIVEEKHIAAETKDWSKVKPEAMDTAVRDTLRHYSYFYDQKDAVLWVKNWIKKNRTKDDLRAYELMEDWRTPMTVGSLVKMMDNGAKLEQKYVERIETAIDELVKMGKTRKAEISQVKVASKSPADIVAAKASEFLAEVETVLDKWETKGDFSLYEALKEKDAPAPIAKAVVDYYTPLKNELTELVTKRTEDLVEAYGHMTIAVRKKYLEFVTKLVADAESFVTGKKTVRKPRVKKPVSIEKQIAKLQYMKESIPFKVTSTNPLNIIGAKEVYLFNTKYRAITRLVSDEGFTIKGTTILGFDEAKSERKVIRKPEEFLKETEKTTRAKCEKVFVALKTKPGVANGRVNSETIVWKTFK